MSSPKTNTHGYGYTSTGIYGACTRRTRNNKCGLINPNDILKLEFSLLVQQQKTR